MAPSVILDSFTGGIDKLDLSVSAKARFTPAFKRAWNSPEIEKLKKPGGLYSVKADLRKVGLPVIVSFEHLHHKHLGPKMEIQRAGDMYYSQLAEVHEQIFEGDAFEDEILRVDLTADVHGVTVQEYGRAMWHLYKQTHQQEYGDGDYYHLTRSVGRGAAQTLYYGRKPHQMRFYNKTLHRLQVLLPALHRQQKKHGIPPSSFQEVYGYDPFEIVTRVERHMGDRETRDVWGVQKFGEIHRLAQCDPFERLRFVEDARGGRSLNDLDGAARAFILLLRNERDDVGVDQMKTWLRSQYRDPRAFRKYWQENEHLILDHNPAIARENLTRQYRSSLMKQLAA